jgi:hypothetical protein
MKKEQFMASSNEYFTPERVDEQIEHLHRTTILDESTNEAQLVNVLHSYYRVPFVPEDRAALEHVRQRILGNQSAGDTLEDENEPVAPLSPSNLVAHPRRTRLMRVLSGLAAVILVGTLVGSWVAVTRMADTPPVVSSGRPSNLYVVQNGVAYRLAGSSGKVIWQDRLSTSRQSGSANIQVVNGVVYVADLARDQSHQEGLLLVRGREWTLVSLLARLHLQRAQGGRWLRILAQYHFHHAKWVRV